MKKLIPFALSLAIAAPLGAQTSSYIKEQTSTTKSNHQHEVEYREMSVIRPKHSTEKPLSSNGVVVDKMFNAFSYLGKTTPFVYEPKSNMYIKVQRGPDGDTRGFLYISGSTDNGKTWTDPVQVYDPADSDGDQARYPSIQVTNPNGSSKLEDLDYTIFAPVLRSTNKVKDFFNGYNLIFKKTGSAPSIFAYPEPDGPDNKDRMTWGISSSIASDEASSKIYLAQFLNTRNIEDTSRIRGAYGTYGFMAADTKLQEATGSLPVAWTYDQFPKSSSTSTVTRESSFNSNPLIDTDAEGNIYTAVLNFWDKELVIDEQRRKVGVSKSTDKGVTWTAFEQIPESAIVAFLESIGADTEQAQSGVVGSTAYHSHGFVVTGKDEFSYIYPLSVTIEGSRVPTIVHAYKENGAWGLKRVAEYSGSIPIFQQIDATSGSLTNDTSSRGNEIQVARTLDGKHLVAKWIDFVPYMIDDQETQVSDIFVSVYDIEKGTWSEKRNVTRDNEFDKLTWLPQTLPNIKEIPVLSIVTNSTNTPGTQDYLNDQLRIDLECSVVSTVFDPLTVSVQEENEIIVDNGIYVSPNPMSNNAEIGFTLKQSSFVTIEIVNILGEKVATVFANQLDAGYKAMYVSTETMSAGSYYINIRTAQGSASTPITIIK